MKLILLLSIITLIPQFCEATPRYLKLLNPPGAKTNNTVTLLVEQKNVLTEGDEYVFIRDGKTIAAIKQPYYSVKNLSSDSIYFFQVYLRNSNGKVIGKSNTINVRTKPEGNFYNIVDYGAVGDGKTLNTEAIQKAINSCDYNGIVIIPKGVYATGALFVKSNMTLYLEEGAVLQGSENLDDYPVVMARFEGIEGEQYASLVNGGSLCGEGIQNFSVRGKGKMIGGGEKLFTLQKHRGKIKRGRIVSLISGENIYLEGTSFIESPSRAVHFIYCSGVTAENIYINTRFNPETGNRYKVLNGDGLTISSSKNVYIFNSTISSQDDNISIKSGRNKEGRRIGRSSEYIRIFNTKFHSGLGVALGSEMSGSIRNVIVQDCMFENTAFVVQLKAPWGRGGMIENIKVKNISHTDTVHGDTKWHRGGICIDQYYGVETPDFSIVHSIDDSMPLIRDVWCENISLNRKNGKAIYLNGRPEMYLKNINFKNVYAKAPEGIWGLYVDQLKLENVVVKHSEGEVYTWKNVKGVKIDP